MLIDRIRNAFTRGKLRNEEINAVHDDDLESLLSSLGLIHDIRTGDARCKFCRDVVDLDSIQAILPDSGMISIVCNKGPCIRKFLDYSGENDG